MRGRTKEQHIKQCIVVCITDIVRWIKDTAQNLLEQLGVIKSIG